MTLQEKLRSFVSILLDWGNQNKRDFPWRHTKNPYKILIAEILLQRTKADQVLPIYILFADKYPTISDLAKATEEEIFELIKPLGLAKRAKGIKQMAQQIINEYGNKIPKKRTQLLKIHWVGKYIANAVLCHAYGIRVPTYDANFARLIDRFFSLTLKKPKQKDPKGYDFAVSLMPYTGNQFKEFNLGVIDFADAICKPRKPLCVKCPISSTCKFYQNPTSV